MHAHIVAIGRGYGTRHHGQHEIELAPRRNRATTVGWAGSQLECRCLAVGVIDITQGSEIAV
jgi:hypothetical protein